MNVQFLMQMVPVSNRGLEAYAEFFGDLP